MTPRDGRWSDATQALAIRAAVRDRTEALAAWRRLEATVDLADLWDAEVYRLLPLVWRNLGDDTGPADAELLRGAYRRSWVQNQHLVRHGAEAAAELTAAGIDTLVLKGVPLALCYYRDLGARPMGDVDLLVPAGRVTEAWRILEGLGYETISVRGRRPSRWEQEGDDDWYRRMRHARGFRRGPLDTIDLHATLSLDFVGADPAVSDVSAEWADARPFAFGGVEARTLSPTHHLFHAVVHGLGASESTILRWVPDALAILRAAGDEIDWDAFAAAADRHRCSLVVREGVEHLVEVWGAPVPQQALGALRAVHPDRREEILRWIRRRAGGPLVGSGYAAGLFVTSTRGLGPLATAARAPGFLADHWQVDRRRHVPLVLARKLRPGTGA